MDLESPFNNKHTNTDSLDINSLTGKSVEEITEVVEKTIVIDVMQGIAKIVLSGLPDKGVFLGQTENKHIKTLILISVDTILNNIDYNNPENKLRN